MLIEVAAALSILDFNCQKNYESTSQVLLSAMENPEKLEVITFRDCNLTQFDFSALSLFSNLEYIRVEGGSLIEFTKMPSLSNLKIVHVNSPQFRRWYNPRLTPKIHSITLHNITNDVTTDEIIDSLLFYKNTLRELAISYSNLTRIPPKVKQFTNLYTFEFQRNPLMSALRAGSFPPTFKPKLLLLSFNNITLIEADTFQGELHRELYAFSSAVAHTNHPHTGNFSGTNIDLTGSHLPSLEEALFEPILRSMNSGQSGEIELGSKPSLYTYKITKKCVPYYHRSQDI